MSSSCVLAACLLRRQAAELAMKRMEEEERRREEEDRETARQPVAKSIAQSVVAQVCHMTVFYHLLSGARPASFGKVEARKTGLQPT